MNRKIITLSLFAGIVAIALTSFANDRENFSVGKLRIGPVGNVLHSVATDTKTETIDGNLVVTGSISGTVLTANYTNGAVSGSMTVGQNLTTTGTNTSAAATVTGLLNAGTLSKGGVPVVTNVTAIGFWTNITATAAVTKFTSAGYDSTGAAITNLAGIPLLSVTNATVTVTILGGETVLTNLTLTVLK